MNDVRIRVKNTSLHAACSLSQRCERMRRRLPIFANSMQVQEMFAQHEQERQQRRQQMEQVSQRCCKPIEVIRRNISTAFESVYLSCVQACRMRHDLVSAVQPDLGHAVASGARSPRTDSSNVQGTVSPPNLPCALIRASTFTLSLTVLQLESAIRLFLLYCSSIHFLINNLCWSDTIC